MLATAARMQDRPSWRPWLCESCGKRIIDLPTDIPSRVRVKCHHRDPETKATCNTVQIARFDPDRVE